MLCLSVPNGEGRHGVRGQPSLSMITLVLRRYSIFRRYGDIRCRCQRSHSLNSGTLEKISPENKKKQQTVHVSPERTFSGSRFTTKSELSTPKQIYPHTFLHTKTRRNQTKVQIFFFASVRDRSGNNMQTARGQSGGKEQNWTSFQEGEREENWLGAFTKNKLNRRLLKPPLTNG